MEFFHVLFHSKEVPGINFLYAFFTFVMASNQHTVLC
jgi:hypothetical protein